MNVILTCKMILLYLASCALKVIGISAKSLAFLIIMLVDCSKATMLAPYDVNKNKANRKSTNVANRTDVECLLFDKSVKINKFSQLPI